VEIIELELSKIKPYAKNAKTHPEDQVQLIANSIKEFGFKTPIVIDENFVIIQGHGRRLASQSLGLETVPCVIADDLSREQVKMLRLADNKVAESEWDIETLDMELSELNDLFTLDDFGFDFEVPNDYDEDEADSVPELEENPCIKRGDLIELGNHRLLCGDSTSEKDVARLMDEKRADMVFTDPPYNIDYQGVSDKREKIKNDKMGDKDFVKFLENSLMSCETMYVCCSWQYAHLFREAMESIARKPKAMIIWDKVNPAQHLDKYFKQHEIIYYYGDFGGHKTLRGDVWQLKRERNTLHPTMKPVELIEMALSDQSDKKIVQDSFLGSGSTMIACENQNKSCYGMELDEKYAQVIIQRWCDYTSIDTIKINGEEVSWSEYKDNALAEMPSD